MAIYRTVIDKSVIRFSKNKYESEFLRKYFKEQYNIEIGMYSMGFFDRWRIPPGTRVGRYSTIDKSVRLIDANHPTSALSTHPFFYEQKLGVVAQDKVHPVAPVVEDDVWMGHNSVATPECKRIGRGSIIGAGSVVMADVPRYAVMIGAPARLVKFRFRPDVIDAIEATQWWLLDKHELKRGLDASDFLAHPSVESAAAFMRALGRKLEIAPRADDASREAEPVIVPSREATTYDPRVLQLLGNEIESFSPSQIDTPFDRLAIDSLGLLNLRTAVEQLLGTRISNRKWGEISSPADLLNMVSPRAPAEASTKPVKANGARPPVAVPPASAENGFVLDLLRNEIPSFSPSQMNTPFDRLAIDSLGLLNLRTAVEQYAGTRLSNRKWGEVSTPADLAALVSPRVPEPAARGGQQNVEPKAVEIRPEPESPAKPERRLPTALYWLPSPTEWGPTLEAIETSKDPRDAWSRLVEIAGKNLDFGQTQRVDAALRRHFGEAPPSGLATKPIRLAVIGSSTLGHLLPSIRVAALRRGLHVTTHEGDYGQYLQELADPNSGLFAFRPDFILLALDAYHLTRGLDPAADLNSSEAACQEIVSRLQTCWRLARQAKIPIIQQAALPIFAPILGNNEHRLPGSRQRLVARLNELLRQMADEQGVDLLAVDVAASAHGVDAWHDPMLWHRGKQEITPLAAPLYGDLVARLLAARQGRSFKCLVLDLDNTLWGGVIGDDGLEGILLGQGDATGEAFVEMQSYALQQAKRGVILAVCSKNDEANALAAFEKHPEMILKRSDIACFVANWDDKAKNIRRIAKELNIGLDSLVFVDDNPFERNLVRGELPMVAVPELGEDPAFYPRTIADAGYFEGLRITEEDRERTRQYQMNAERSALQAEAADLPSYLRGLGMELIWKRFDSVGLQRIVQLINKTNQFNLTTRRYTENDITAIMADPNAFGLQLRLTDRYGDNGIIAIVIGKRKDDEVRLDTWLMSCRVLGRQVEEATLGLVVAEAEKWGATRIIGEFIPTAKNGMVRDHYGKLGFTALETSENGATLWALDRANYRAPELFMKLREG